MSGFFTSFFGQSHRIAVIILCTAFIQALFFQPCSANHDEIAVRIFYRLLPGAGSHSNDRLQTIDLRAFVVGGITAAW